MKFNNNKNKENSTIYHIQYTKETLNLSQTHHEALIFTLGIVLIITLIHYG